MEENRKTEVRRIARLFRPYRARLTAVLGLILLSAGLGMVSPFLLRQVLDTAIPDRDTALLTWLVLGMIGISIATGALGVAQTWISNLVGQRVMHDLRSAVYRHLQRLSLAFFTRTRTGEVQSRIANDIGGIQGVVTSTATSIVSNVTTVIAAVVAMFLLDWRLAVFALALLPLFVLLTRRIGNHHRRHLHRHGGRLHPPPDAPVLPDEQPALGRPRHPELARPVRADLRVPRPAGRHRPAPRRRRAHRRRRRRADGRRLVPL